MGLPFTAGQKLLATDLNTATQQGAWTSYTPTWTGSTTNPVIGNGTIVGYYGKVGRVVTAKIFVSTGSTTTYGSGYYGFSLPLTAAVTGVVAGQFAHGGVCNMINNATTYYTGNAVILQNTPAVVNVLLNNNSAYAGASNPVAFTGANTEFQITITYESTS